jgi:hypothetical protein
MDMAVKGKGNRFAGKAFQALLYDTLTSVTVVCMSSCETDAIHDACSTHNMVELKKLILQVTAMVSVEQERVPLCRTLNPKTAQGAVEKWLIDCEQIMLDTVKSVIQQGFDAYTISERSEWALNWPGQVVLAVSCMYWTQEVRPFWRSNLHLLSVLPACVIQHRLAP